MPRISEPTLEAHRAATTDRLLDAFGELVMTRGYADVSLADVAARAGLARTAIYNYFQDPEALLFAWTEREVARTTAILEGEIAAAETCAEKLRIFVEQQLLDFASRHLPPGREVVQFLRPDSYERFMRHIAPVERLARTIVAEGVDRGEFAPVDLDATVPFILACIGTERAPVALGQHDIGEATERITSFLLRALQPPEPNADPPPAHAGKRRRA